MRLLLALLVGLVAPFLAERALAALLHEPWHPGPVCWWVADRDAGRLVGLDAELFETREIPCEAPLELAVRADGGLFVLGGTRPWGSGARWLHSFDVQGMLLARIPLAGAEGLAVVGGEEAAVLAGGRLVLFGPNGAERMVREAPGARALAVRGGELVLGDGAGRVALYSRAWQGALLAEVELGAGVVALAQGPAGGSWALLDGGGAERRLVLLGHDLEVLRELSIGPLGTWICPLEQRGGWELWVATKGEKQVLCMDVQRLDPVLLDLPLAASGAPVAAPAGGFLAPAAGAVLAFGPRGELIRSQGGFDYAVASARAPP
jgi:hypothetical protein